MYFFHIGIFFFNREESIQDDVGDIKPKRDDYMRGGYGDLLGKERDTVIYVFYKRLDSFC